MKVKEMLQSACLELNVEALEEIFSSRSEDVQTILSEIGNELLSHLITGGKRFVPEKRYTLATEEELSDPRIVKFKTERGWVVKVISEEVDSYIDEPAFHCCKILLKNGVKPNRENIVDAMRFERVEILEMFLDSGIEISQAEIEESGCEAEFNEKILTLLIQYGKYDVNANLKGFPRICMAALALNQSLIKFLVVNGADVNVVMTGTASNFFDDEYAESSKKTKREMEDYFKKNISEKGPFELCYVLANISEKNMSELTSYDLFKLGRQTEELIKALMDGNFNVIPIKIGVKPIISGEEFENALGWLENVCAYYDIFQKQYLLINQLVNEYEFMELSQFIEGFKSRYEHVLERLQRYNQSMLLDYLRPEFLEQKNIEENPLYARFTEEAEYEDREKLDHKISVTKKFMGPVINFVAFINLLGYRPDDFKMEMETDRKMFYRQFIKPVNDCIKKYENAVDQVDKIAAYKSISLPFKELAVEMYKRAVKEYRLVKIREPEFIKEKKRVAEIIKNAVVLAQGCRGSSNFFKSTPTHICIDIAASTATDIDKETARKIATPYFS